MKHTIITLALLAAVVAPSAYAMQEPATSNGSGSINTVRAEKNLGGNDITPAQVRAEIQATNQGTSTQAGKTAGDTFGHVQAAVRDLPIADALKARIETRLASTTNAVDALRARAEEHLSEIPSLIIGVCASQTSASSTPADIREMLKEKCETTLSTGVSHATSTSQIVSACANIDTLTDDDIIERCASIQEKKSELATHLAEVRAKVEAKYGDANEWLNEKKEALADSVKDRIAAYATRMIARLQAAINRLSELADRVDSRIATLEDEGIDTATASELVTEARASLNSASSLLEDPDTLIESILTDTAREHVSIVKEALRAAVEDIRDARSFLSQALDSLQEHSEETE